MADQNTLAWDIAVLFMGIFALGGGLFAIWAGPKSTAGHWPHAQTTATFSLMAAGLVSFALGLNIGAWIQASWGQSASVACMAIGVLLGCLSFCWLGFLDLRYSLDPSNVLDDPRNRLGRRIAAESFFIALTVGYVAGAVVYWQSSGNVILAWGIFAATLLLAFCIARLLLKRVVPQHGQRG